MSHTYDRVVVAGGSIAGLLAAAALAPLSREVVVLDRDTACGPDGPPAPCGPSRARAPPQALQSHGLLASGRLAMEELLPGLTDALLAEGAISRGDIGTNGRWWIGGGLVADATVGANGIAVSRRLVESTVRRLVAALPQVDLRPGADVVGLVSDASGSRVAGVRLRGGAPDRAGAVLAADLVVDATGRSGRGAAWLGAAGWPQPAMERVRVGVRYATARVERREDDLDGRLVTVSAATPATPRVAVAIAQEDGTWTVSLCGYADEQPPVDPDGFRSYAAAAVSPDVAHLLAGRELIGPVASYRFPDCRRRRYDRVSMPPGFVPIGDAIASFDPTFGQGMSVAALEAVLLRRLAATGESAVRTRYPHQAMAIAERAWTVVVGADLQLPGVEGARPRGHALLARYVRRVQRVARHDPAVARALMRVTNLLDPPPALMRPAVMARVLAPRRVGSRAQASIASGSPTVSAPRSAA